MELFQAASILSVTMQVELLEWHATSYTLIYPTYVYCLSRSLSYDIVNYSGTKKLDKVGFRFRNSSDKTWIKWAVAEE